MHLVSSFFTNIFSDMRSIKDPPEWECLLQTALGEENRISQLLFRSKVASVALRIFGASLGSIASFALYNSIVQPSPGGLLLSSGAGMIAHDCFLVGLNIKAEIDALKSSDDKRLWQKAVEKIALAKKALDLLQMDKIERWVHLACPNTWICQPLYKAISQ